MHEVDEARGPFADFRHAQLRSHKLLLALTAAAARVGAFAVGSENGQTCRAQPTTPLAVTSNLRSAGLGASATRPPSRAAIGAALLAVYLIWGSTYLAMRVALEAWPPLLMGGVRFTTAGALLYALLRARGTPAPTLRGWLSAALVGVLLLTMGNGLVAFAQSRMIDSGVAATVIATMPMWMALLAVAFGTRPSRNELFGLLLGMLGVALLSGGGNLHAGWAATAAIVLAPVSWALGSLVGLKLPLPKGLMSAAPQMIVGGVVMLALGALRGEALPHDIALRTHLALAYLIVFGSLIGFTAYGFLLRSTRPAVASSYAYVNPIVALVLGALLGGETLSAWKVMACGLTVLGVIVISWHRTKAKRG